MSAWSGAGAMSSCGTSAGLRFDGDLDPVLADEAIGSKWSPAQRRDIVDGDAQPLGAGLFGTGGRAPRALFSAGAPTGRGREAGQL